MFAGYEPERYLRFIQVIPRLLPPYDGPLVPQIMAGVDDEFEGESRLSDWANVSHFLFPFCYAYMG